MAYAFSACGKGKTGVGNHLMPSQDLPEII